MKMFEYWLKFHLSLFKGFQVTISQTGLDHVMAWQWTGDMTLLEITKFKFLIISKHKYKWQMKCLLDFI